MSIQSFSGETTEKTFKLDYQMDWYGCMKKVLFLSLKEGELVDSCDVVNNNYKINRFGKIIWKGSFGDEVMDANMLAEFASTVGSDGLMFATE